MGLHTAHLQKVKKGCCCRNTLYSLLLLLVALTLTSCRDEERDHKVYDKMFLESRERVMFVGNDIAEKDAKEILNYAEQHNSRYGKVLAYMSLANLAAQRANFEDMARYMEIAQASLDFKDPPFLQGYAYFVDGTVNYCTHLVLNSLICYDKALHYFLPLRDSLMIASCYINKFNCYCMFNNLEAATSCLESAKEWAPASFQFNIRLYFAMLHNDLSQSQEAIKSFASLIEDARKDSSSHSYPSQNNARFWTLLYSNYIFALIGANEIDKAEEQCNIMEKTAANNGTCFDSTIQRLMTAWVAFAQNETDKTLEICHDIYANYHSDHTYTVQQQVLNLLVQCYNELGNYKLAFEYNNKLTQITYNQKFNAQIIKEIVERQQTYETQIHKLEMGRMRTRIWLLLVGSMLTITIIAFLLYRKDRHLKERQTRIRELEQEHMLTLKQNEIDSTKMAHATTQEQMESFANEMRRISSEMPKNLRIKLINGINRIEEYREQDQWDNFEHSFSRQHNGFIEQLLQKHPSLSPIEVKICMLIRVGLTNREISDTLHLADNTVRTYRTRMRKKLYLTENDDLNKYISAI